MSPSGSRDEFRLFSELGLDSASFDTSAGDPRSDLFHASIESFRALSAWTTAHRSKDARAFTFEPGFVEDRRPNALADVWNGTHMIGMHSSLFVCLSEFAFFCFAQREFFVGVGDPSQEISPAPWDARVPGLWLLDFTAEGGHVEEVHSKQLVPRDQERYFAAVWLGQLMARNVWLHELAHCYSVHVGFAKTHKLAPRLYELADPLQAVSVARRNLGASPFGLIRIARETPRRDGHVILGQKFLGLVFRQKHFQHSSPNACHVVLGMPQIVLCQRNRKDRGRQNR